jgi:hypothetical protein
MTTGSEQDYNVCGKEVVSNGAGMENVNAQRGVWVEGLYICEEKRVSGSQCC